MADDDSAEFIRSLPEPLAEEILEALHDEQSEDVEHLLGYDEDTAAESCRPMSFRWTRSLTVKQAIELLQDSEDYEMVSTFMLPTNITTWSESFLCASC